LEGRVPAGLSAAEGRKFAFTVGAAFAVLGGIVWWRGHIPIATVFGVLAGSLLLAGLLVPGRLTRVHGAWMGMALAISKVTTPIVMAVIYFLVLTPTALLRRTLGGNPLVHADRAGSYFVNREPGAARRSDITRQF
jgi:hypothetical protein